MHIGGREGHFLLESGHHGTLWLDLDGLFLHPADLAPSARELAARIAPYAPEVVVGPLTGGAFLAQLVALELGARFAYSSPGAPATSGLYTRTYAVPAPLHPFIEGRRTALLDDVINAGSAVTATQEALTGLGAQVVVAGALLTLGDTGRARLAGRGVPVESLETRRNEIHPPSTCPRCARGVPLEAVAQ